MLKTAVVIVVALVKAKSPFNIFVACVDYENKLSLTKY